jgi:hypothetical protein
MSKKLLLYTALAISIAVPIVPDKYKVGINITQPEVKENSKSGRYTEVVKATCELEADFITSSNIHVCRYKCSEGGSISITSINRSNSCQQTIKADVKISKKNAI